MLPVRKKVFESTPFSKGVAGLQGGALREASEKGRHTVSIDLPPKINGSGIPDSMPFHKKYVVPPQIKFSDRPLFQKGSPGAGRGPCKERWVVERGTLQRAGTTGEKQALTIDKRGDLWYTAIWD